MPPSLVAKKIFDVLRSGTWQLRHLVGPDAVPVTENRKAMTDEEWVALNGADYATSFATMGM